MNIILSIAINYNLRVRLVGYHLYYNHISLIITDCRIISFQKSYWRFHKRSSNQATTILSTSHQLPKLCYFLSNSNLVAAQFFSGRYLHTIYSMILSHRNTQDIIHKIICFRHGTGFSFFYQKKKNHKHHKIYEQHFFFSKKNQTTSEEPTYGSTPHMHVRLEH